MKRIGIIGVGLLGSPIAERILAGGLPICGFDIRPEANSRLKSMGGAVTADARAVAASVDCLILSLPNADISASVLADVTGQLQPGSVVIDTTTGEPDLMASFGKRLAAMNISYLDTTVGGSSVQVREGTAIVMAGGPEETLSVVEPLLKLFASSIFRVGGWGAGARMKLIHNLVLGLNRAVLAEGLALCEKAHIDPTLALQLLQAGASYSRAMDAKGAKMIERNFEPHAKLSQHRKDVDLILALGEQTRAYLPLSRLHRELLRRAEAEGWGNADNSSIIEIFRTTADDPANTNETKSK